MSSTKFFRFPWAMSGDKAFIPDTIQVDGSVSYPEGFGVDYELELGVDAAALPVPRPESNQLYYDVTSNLRAWQLAGLPEWVAAAQNGGVAVTYPRAALVRHNYTGVWMAYLAQVETTTEPGTSADWSTPLIDAATVAEIRAGTAGKLVRVDNLWGAGAFVALTDAPTIALDLSTGINFYVTLGGNRTLGSPTNPKVGQSGIIKVTQDATGGRTLSFGGDYKFFDGLTPGLSTSANAVNVLHYEVLPSSVVAVSYIRGLA